MKKRRNLLISILLSVIIISFLAFYFGPHIIEHIPFVMGFLSCLIFISTGLVFAIIWNKLFPAARPQHDISSTETIPDPKSGRSVYWILILLSMIMIGVVSMIFIYKQNEMHESRIQYQNTQLELESELIASGQTKNLVVLMGNLLDKVDEEIANDPQRRLTDETINRIADLSYSLKPYKYLEGDSLSSKRISPERGQLLLALVKINMDSGSFKKIKLKTTFASAMLSGADLRGVDLSGANLDNANLKDANLSAAKLNKINMNDANLWGANLTGAELNDAELKRSNLAWAELNGAIMKRSNLDGASLKSAKFRNADLENAQMKYANLSNAIFNGAQLPEVDMFGSDLSRSLFNGANLSRANMRNTKLTDTDFTNTNLKDAVLRGAVLSGTNMSGVDLSNVFVKRANWLEQLSDWKVIGARDIQHAYKIRSDDSFEANFIIERVED